MTGLGNFQVNYVEPHDILAQQTVICRADCKDALKLSEGHYESHNAFHMKSFDLIPFQDCSRPLTLPNEPRNTGLQ